MMAERQLPASQYFQLQQLADGVYAAINILGNAGIVDLGDRTLVYDSLFMPQAGEDLRRAAEMLTGRPVDAVLNSHWHYDHIWGNQAFSADSDIIATIETRRLILETRGVEDFDSIKVQAEKSLASLQAKFQAAENEDRRRQLTPFIDDCRSILAALPVLLVRPPNVAFSQRLEIYGSRRTVELIPFASGHTLSDTLLYLPQDGIAFMSDLLFSGAHPYLGDGDPDSYRQILEDVSALAPGICVPGHGPIGGQESLELMKQYIDTLNGLARKLVETGEAEELIDAIEVPEPFKGWLFTAFFSYNLHCLYARWVEKRAAAG